MFIHIPKAAGSSIVFAMGKSQGSRDHLPWYVYYTANPYKFKEYYKFSFVRNPWGRAYSAYRYLQAGGNKKNDIPVADAVNSYRNFDRFLVDGLGRGHFRNHLLFIPQAQFILGPNEETMVDFVGRYENIQEDFAQVTNILGITAPLPVLNRGPISKKGNYTFAYSSAESVAVIDEIYKQDITVFNYKFK